MFWFVVFVQLPTELANQASDVPHPSKVWFDMETSTLTVCDDAGALNNMVVPRFDKHAVQAFNKTTNREKRNDRFRGLLELFVDMAGGTSGRQKYHALTRLSTYT